MCVYLSSCFSPPRSRPKPRSNSSRLPIGKPPPVTSKPTSATTDPPSPESLYDPVATTGDAANDSDADLKSVVAAQYRVRATATPVISTLPNG